MDYDLDAIDMDVLNEAHSLLSKRWPEMVGGYIEDSNMYIDNIKNGFLNDDKDAIASNAHPLKSSSNALGIISIGEIAKKVEYDTKDAIENGGDIMYLQELIPLMGEALELAKQKLEATLVTY